MSVPDADIFPYATGDAALTVKEHSSPQDLVFWAGWFCPFVQRSWITLEEKGIPYQYKEVNPYEKDKHFLEINPKGLIPAVEYQGRPLYESLIICEFLEDAYPHHTPLLPSDPFTLAEARLWIDHVSKTIVPGFFRVVMAQEKDKQENALEELKTALRAFTDKVKGPYFLGDQWSLVDSSIAPWVVRDNVARDHRGYRREDVSEKWKKYAEQLETRKSVLSTTSEECHYEKIVSRYLRNEAQSETAKATRDGRPIP
ncbi:glutathione-S-transferase [Stereum hirsutum FP-91666 SS1]|uniref:glutathione-S-transferase n=1 Tax=Stereum hirsutum (strain FP-91666) TaxID=721885 RepID=UPI0004449DEE|nr:glutathione-S-transferase [Stereum hirsutum FP-91666 SS1]EIM84249.1 glutathione-S-transferase [Stereum hirsutum FP-91666 SS1]